MTSAVRISGVMMAVISIAIMCLLQANSLGVSAVSSPASSSGVLDSASSDAALVSLHAQRTQRMMIQLKNAMEAQTNNKMQQINNNQQVQESVQEPVPVAAPVESFPAPVVESEYQQLVPMVGAAGATASGETAGLQAILGFFVRSLTRSMSRSDTPMSKFINGIFTGMFPKGLNIGGIATISSITVPTAITFPKPELSGFTVTDNNAGVLRINVQRFRIGVQSLSLVVNFANSGSNAPNGPKLITIKNVEFLASITCTIDTAKLPNIVIAPALVPGRYSFKIGSIELSGSNWGFVDEMVMKSLAAPIPPITLNPLTMIP